MPIIKVAVTGASGRTGRLVVQRLLCEPERYHPVAVVRSKRAAEEMQRLFLAAAAARREGDGGDADRVSTSPAVGTVHILDFCEGLKPDTRDEEDDGSHPSDAERRLRDEVFAGCRALIVASSSVAEPKAWASLASAAHVAGSRLLGKVVPRLAKHNAAFVPVATWKGGQTPRVVDWLGARRLFRAFFAARRGEEGEDGGDDSGRHIVLISSAGGCDPCHFLNRIARGEVLNWKRRAEQEMVRMCREVRGGGGEGGEGGKSGSGSKSRGPVLLPPRPPPPPVTYTILHPNHLIDGGAGGPSSPKVDAAFFTRANDKHLTAFFDPRRSHLLLAVDDALQRPHWSRRPRVPRGALAELAVQCVALARPAAGSGGGGAAAASTSSSSSWCAWEEEEGRAGGAASAAAPAPAAPALNRAVDVGVEPRRKGEGDNGAAATAEAACSSPQAMTRLFAALLRAMPGDCDYGINDRTIEDGGLRWACADA